MTQDKNLQEAILNNLARLPGGDTETLKALFSDNLNYDFENDPVPTRNWPEPIKKKLESIRFRASHRDFKVIWARLKSDRLSRGDERPIINSVNKEYPYNLIVFSNSDSTRWDFVNVKLVAGQESEDNRLPERRRIVRRISVTEPFGLRTGAERLAMLAVDMDRQPLEIQQYHDDAFDVEKVTKEFYTLIAVAFTALAGGEREVKSIKAIINRLNLNPNLFGIDWSSQRGQLSIDGLIRIPYSKERERKQEFTVRLIGRLLFCWFLKKKKSIQGSALIPEDILSRKAVAEWLDYYHDLLEIVFFQVMNKPKDERRPELKTGALKDIPFLNGGLFEPHEDDLYPYFNLMKDHKADVRLKIPNEWFADLFSVFESYNFTIDENTSIDIDLSIDPEMLGKIFENLLAEINPETGKTARKATGSYYTPRPIVEYMVDESLKQYLITKTEIDENRVAGLLAYDLHEHDLSMAEMDAVIDALDTLKIIDPACGSGAFPMGILQKIMLILQKVDPDSKKWLSRLLESIPDPNARETMRRKLEGESELWDFTRKLGIIRKSIYGIDIQSIAVEISKLRFFLSLVVDEKVDDSQDNWNIEPLPNLEFKFVAANSLIGLSDSQQYDLEDQEYIERLRKLRDEYFISYGKEKKKIENEFTKLQEKLFEHAVGWQKKKGMALDLAKWEPFKRESPPGDESQQWFDSSWMFGIERGFDIVIGNPPYLESRNSTFTEKMKSDYQYWTKKRWPNYSHLITRGSDLLIYFLECGISLIDDKGVIVLLTQNSWLDANYGKLFQDFLLKNTFVSKIVDSDYKYFKAGTGPNINTIVTLFIGKGPKKEEDIKFINYHVSFENMRSDYSYGEGEKSELEIDDRAYCYNDQILSELKWGILKLCDEVIMELINNINKSGYRIEEIPDCPASIGQGLNLTKDYLADSRSTKEFPFLRGSLIPIMTTEDGAPFELTSTKYCLINREKITKGQKNKLHKKGYRVFDFDSTSKIVPDLIMPRGIGRYYCSINKVGAYSSSSVDIYDNDNKMDLRKRLNLWLFLNSSASWLLREISGRKNLGGGMLKAEATDLRYFGVYFEFDEFDKIKSIYKRLSERHADEILVELTTPEHKTIDEIVFDHLQIPNNKRSLIVEHLANFVGRRAAKSRT